MSGKLKGRSHLPEYYQWAGMIARCMNPRSPSWPRYGGAGITVSPEWLGQDGLDKFRAHIGPKPTPKHQIDRIDGTKGYAPGNVRWATSREQNRNKRSNQFLTFNGETLCHAEWAERLGISRQSLLARLRKWPLEKALTERGSVRGYRPDNLMAPQREALIGLSAKCGTDWVRPMDIGGTRTSRHNDLLRSLFELGMIERKQRCAPDGMVGIGPEGFGRSRGSWVYRITDLGRAALATEGGTDV